MNRSVIWIVVLVVLVLLGIWFWNASQSDTGSMAGETTLPSGQSSDDASLDQDMSAINTQFDAFASDNAAVDAGLNDSQVEQSSL